MVPRLRLRLLPVHLGGRRHLLLRDVVLVDQGRRGHREPHHRQVGQQDHHLVVRAGRPECRVDRRGLRVQRLARRVRRLRHRALHRRRRQDVERHQRRHQRRDHHRHQAEQQGLDVRDYS